eukprot:898855-Pyramimonas_sp.AAC.1
MLFWILDERDLFRRELRSNTSPSPCCELRILMHASSWTCPMINGPVLCRTGCGGAARTMSSSSDRFIAFTTSTN